MNKINVLVTGSGGGGIGEQVIKCLRLATLDVFILGTDVTEVSKGRIDADEFLLAPMANTPEYLPFLLDQCAQKNIRALVPGSKGELKVLSANRQHFAEKGIALLVNSESVIQTCLDKNLSGNFLQENGFASPRSFRIAGESDLSAIDVLPLVLKPSVGGGGSVNTMIAQTPEELKVFGKFLLSQYNEFIAQEYVGDAGSEYTVGVLSTREG